MKRERILVLGAAGRDFHNFNVFFRENDRYEIVGFTAAQIPGIADRRYPPVLSGKLYPEGIPIYPEADFEKLVKELGVDVVILAYSDLSFDTVMRLGSRAIAAGADFQLMGGARTMVESKVPVIAVCAVRTGCGKSQTSRAIAKQLREAGKRVVAVRHPMPYGDLSQQVVQRFAEYADFERHGCTIEEREEYESYIELGFVVYAGVDYEAILRQAEAEADVVIWDGGNNDLPFYRPGLWITVADPLRPGHEMSYYPGASNFLAADVLVINKATVAKPEDLALVEENARRFNPRATVLRAESQLLVDDAAAVRGKRVLCVDDGPTLTHGGMPFGAATIAAREFGAAGIVSPRAAATGSIRELYEKFPHLQDTLPAMGYSPAQIAELERTINATRCDAVLFGTPIDLKRLLKIDKPAVRVRYEYKDLGTPRLSDLVASFLKL